MRIRVFIDVWKHDWLHFSVLCHSPMVTSALALSTAMSCFNASMILFDLTQQFLQYYDNFQFHSVRFVMSFKAQIKLRSIRRKTTCSCSVSSICSESSLFGFLQSYGLPLAPHHQPHAVLFILSPWLGSSPKETFAVLTDDCQVFIFEPSFFASLRLAPEGIAWYLCDPLVHFHGAIFPLVY